MIGAKARMMAAIAGALAYQPRAQITPMSDEDELEGLTTEYKLIMLKQSKLPRSKRDSLVRAYKRLQKVQA